MLTALPHKIKKRKAVVRFMFFNPDDIRWFKPVELWTKEVCVCVLCLLSFCPCLDKGSLSFSVAVLALN